VTDGSAILGLGDLGSAAALPVMEGKVMLFQQFADIDAWPICLSTRDPDEIVRTITNIASGFCQGSRMRYQSDMAKSPNGRIRPMESGKLQQSRGKQWSLLKWQLETAGEFVK